MSRQFKLSPELVDQIIFAMENQNETFLLDTTRMLIVPESGTVPTDDLIPLPSWKPSDGYQLMDSFTGILKNPIYRERLRHILNTGRGVFRGFKNVIKERPDLEKAWFAHKDREMKKRVRNWYAELCDYWGVESMGEEPEETEDLFLDDFTMEEIPADGEDLAAARGALLGELYRNCSPSLKALLTESGIWKHGTPDFAVRALSPDGSSCGFASLKMEQYGTDLYALIDCLYILPEFRGAGIASGLLDYLSEACFRNKVKSLLIQLPPGGGILRENLERRGFLAVEPFLILDIEKWFYEQQQEEY